MKIIIIKKLVTVAFLIITIVIYSSVTRFSAELQEHFKKIEQAIINGKTGEALTLLNKCSEINTDKLNNDQKFFLKFFSNFLMGRLKKNLNKFNEASFYYKKLLIYLNTLNVSK